MKEYLRNLYQTHGLSDKFEIDWNYLSASIGMIDHLWFSNLNEISDINLIILSESPMWGKEKKYFYNPISSPTGFFNYDHLKYIYPEMKRNKGELISCLNSLGAVFLDVSPYPLNPRITSISYKKDRENKSHKISKSEYKGILDSTYTSHLLPRLEKIKSKCNGSDYKKIKFCYRYRRVKNNLEDELIQLLKMKGFQLSISDPVLSVSGQNSMGKIDMDVLKKVFQSFV